MRLKRLKTDMPLILEKRLKEMDVPHIYAEYPGGHHFDSDVMSSLLNHIAYYRGILAKR